MSTNTLGLSKNALKSFVGSDRAIQKSRLAPTSIDQVCREIASEYSENLRHLGYQVVDGDRIPIKTDKNALLYYLLFARSHLINASGG